jgi:DNA (cytosine-5)-methyltransferase 1
MAGPTILSLFSGIGGLELACHIVWPGARVLGYVERDAYAASVLMARMESEALDPAPVWCGAIEDLDCRELEGRVDVVTAGFLCTDLSQAGRRVGIEGDASGLWAEARHVIAHVKPHYVFLENVAASSSGRS